MKAAHVIISGDVAGGQKICGRIVHALYCAGDSAVIVSPSRGEFTDEMEHQGIPVHILPFEKTYHFQNAFRFARLIKKEQIDLVHTHGMVSSNVQSRIAARLAGVPVISHLHLPNHFRPSRIIGAYQKALDNLTTCFCDSVVTISQATRQALIHQGISDHRIRVVYNGIEPSKCIPARTKEDVFREFGLEPSHPLVGMVARLCPVKGQKELILAAREILRFHPQTSFMIVGKDLELGGAYKKFLVELVCKFGLTRRIIFTDYRQDIMDLIHAMDVFVLPSYLEGLAVTILEAMALKRAVIATQVGGSPEIVIEGQTGSLIPPGDVQALSRAVSALLGSPEKARQMGENGYQRVIKHFTERQMIQEILSLYQRVLSQYSNTRRKETPE